MTRRRTDRAAAPSDPVEVVVVDADASEDGETLDAPDPGPLDRGLDRIAAVAARVPRGVAVAAAAVAVAGAGWTGWSAATGGPSHGGTARQTSGSVAAVAPTDAGAGNAAPTGVPAPDDVIGNMGRQGIRVYYPSGRGFIGG